MDDSRSVEVTASGEPRLTTPREQSSEREASIEASKAATKLALMSIGAALAANAAVAESSDAKTRLTLVEEFLNWVDD